MKSVIQDIRGNANRAEVRNKQATTIRETKKTFPVVRIKSNKEIKR